MRRFDNYKKAVDCGGKGYVNIELYRIFSQIFWKAANGLRHTQKVLDASEYLDHWLGRYGSTEELQQLVKELAGNSQYLKIAKENHLEKTVPQTAEQENRKKAIWTAAGIM